MDALPLDRHPRRRRHGPLAPPGSRQEVFPSHDGGVISTWTLLKSGSSRSPTWWHVIPPGSVLMRISWPSSMTPPNAWNSIKRLQRSITASLYCCGTRCRDRSGRPNFRIPLVWNHASEGSAGSGEVRMMTWCLGTAPPGSKTRSFHSSGPHHWNIQGSKTAMPPWLSRKVNRPGVARRQLRSPRGSFAFGGDPTSGVLGSFWPFKTQPLGSPGGTAIAERRAGGRMLPTIRPA